MNFEYLAPSSKTKHLTLSFIPDFICIYISLLFDAIFCTTHFPFLIRYIDILFLYHATLGVFGILIPFIRIGTEQLRVFGILFIPYITIGTEQFQIPRIKSHTERRRNAHPCLVFNLLIRTRFNNAKKIK